MTARIVYVFGELNVDMIVSGREIVPEPNKEKLVDDFEMTLGSSSAITAARLALLGLDVRFVGVVGADPLGAYCIERLRSLGVNADGVRVDPQLKTGVTVSLSTPADRSLLTYMGAIPMLTPEHVPAGWAKEADHVHFGSLYLQKGMQSAWADLFAEARKNGATTSFDLGWDPEEHWQRALVESLLPATDLFLPSETELLHVYDADSLEQAGAQLPQRRGKVAVKRGKAGSALLAPDGRWLQMPGYRVEAVDSTGAGDSFNAGAIYSYLSGGADEELLRFGNACGAMSTLHIGGTGGAFDAGEVESWMRART